MRKLLFILVWVFALLVGAKAQTKVKVHCTAQQGGQAVVTSGVTSSTKVIKTFPGATVNVYTTGTTTPISLWSDAAGTVPLANPFTASSTTADCSFFATLGQRVDVRFSGLGIAAPFTVSDIHVISVLGYDSGAQVFNVKFYGAVGNGVANDTAAIQAAIVAAQGAGGGTLYFPPGTYLVTGTSTEIFLVTKPLRIVGAGKHASIIRTDSSTATTTAVFRYKPTTAGTDSRGFTFEHLSVEPVAANKGSWGLVLDCTNAYIANFFVQHNTFGGETAQFQNGGLLLTNPLTAGDGIFTGQITDNLFWGGVQMLDAGDSIDFSRNVVSGTGVIDFRMVAGAAILLMTGNNITVSEGVVVKRARKFVFAFNNVEMCTSDTGTNGAMLDLQGISTSDRILSSEIIYNTFLSVCGVSVDGVRVNWASSTSVISNDFELPSGKTLTRITANSLGSQTFYNVARGVSISQAVNAGDPNYLTAPVLYETLALLPATNQLGLLAVEGARIGNMIFLTGVPSVNPPAGYVYVYVESGTLKARGASGTITTLAAP